MTSAWLGCDKMPQVTYYMSYKHYLQHIICKTSQRSYITCHMYHIPHTSYTQKGFRSSIAKKSNLGHVKHYTSHMSHTSHITHHISYTLQVTLFFKSHSLRFRSILQVMSNTLDIGVTGQNYIPDLYSVIDYTTFVNSIDLTFSTCQPKRFVGLYNISRPFG